MCRVTSAESSCVLLCVNQCRMVQRDAVRIFSRDQNKTVYIASHILDCIECF